MRYDPSKKQGARGENFLAGGGEMGKLIRSMDWSATPLGPVESWPQSLRTTVSLCLASNFPISIAWGPQRTQIYNDGYWPICGAKHPHSMGQDFKECWFSAWPAIGDAFERASAGETSFLVNRRMFLDRNGYLEETFFTFSFSPIRDEQGKVGGLFHPVTEMTEQSLAERRLNVLRGLADRTADAKTVEDACALTAKALTEHQLDVPFALLFLFDPDIKRATLAASTGIQAGSAISPNSVDLSRAEFTSWPLAEVASNGQQPKEINDLAARFGSFSCGPYPEAPNAALMLPIILPGLERTFGVLVAGVSSRRALDQAYRIFYRMLGEGVSNALANARAYEEERKRAEALTELDRAKTTFFSNISHEFRTPLTLILGPTQDALAEIDEPRQRERLEVVYRNALRLQKLVNTLLDFSRIEAGRIQAVYEPTELGVLTRELASNFRSACEKAGLRLIVDCDYLAEFTYVDREMWEKIVLNLISNAFKYTLAGEIEVTLRESGGEESGAAPHTSAGPRHAVLRVRDTGIGIPEHELPNITRRFYRVEGARGRTHEGSGIGLSLVQELVKLHGGDIKVDSVYGQGSTFTVRIPLGKAHLPAEKLSPAAPLASSRSEGNAYVQEALRWLSPAGDVPEEHWLPATTVPDGFAHAADAARIVVADDNADMRDYVRRLLAPHYRVESLADGQAALAAARREKPDLIVADVMMPGMDGFALLGAIREDETLRTVPVIMLSARAGEESRVEGLDAGADDYLTKPFTVRELLARVRAQLGMARVRREAERTLRESEERYRRLLGLLPVAVYTCEAPSGIITYYNENAARLWGRAPTIGESDERFCGSFKLFRSDGTPLPYDETPMAMALRTGAEFRNEEVVIGRSDGTRITVLVNIDPVIDGSGRVAGAVNAFIDTTALSQAEAGIRQRTAQFETLLQAAPLGVYLIDGEFRIREVNPTAVPVFGGIPDLIGRDFDEVIHTLWPKAYADEVGERFRHTLETGEPHVVPELIEKRIDTGATGYYEWQIHRIPLPEGGHGVVCYFRDISAQVLARQRIAESEERFRAVVSQTSAGITRADTSGRIIFANRKFCEMLDCAESELLDKTVWDITFPADLETNKQLFEQLAATGAPFETEKRLIRKDGTLIWANVSVAPIRDEAGKPQSTVAVAIDITRRKQVEAALRESEEKYRSLFESIDEGFALIEMIFDEAGKPVDYRYLETNAVFEQQTGLKDARGKTARQLVPDLEQWWIDTYGKVAVTGESARFENNSEPMHRWFDVYASRMGAEPSRKVALVFNNITERKRAEEALREADRRKDDFMAMLGHELRNPLGIISNAVQLLRRVGGPEAQFADVREMIERQVIHTSRMVDDMLDVSRISHGKIQLAKQPWDLRDIVRQTAEEYQSALQENGSKLEVNLPQRPLRIIADRTRLAQAVGNLLHNAGKFSESGGTIRITLEVDAGSHALIRVRDEGIGIDPEVLEWVFEPFKQADRTLDRSQGGLGLGLSLVKAIVELHGGQVKAFSEGPGRGSEFTVRLPLDPSPSKLAEALPEEDGAAQSRRILIIEDNRVAARSTRLLLEHMGHITEVAHTGNAGIEAAGRFHPEVVLCDIGLPELDGYKVAQTLRKQPGLARCLMVAVSGYMHDDQRAREAGFDAHLLKPIDFGELRRRLAEFNSEPAAGG